MIKAIIFDFDLTLSNREASIYDVFAPIVKKYFRDLDWLEQEAIIQGLMLNDEFGNSHKDIIAENFAKRYHLDLQEVKEDFKDYTLQMAKHTILDPETLDVLNALKGKVKLGMITNGIYESQRLKLETVDIFDYFDDIIIAGGIGISKPDPRIYILAAEHLNLKVEECLFVGDLVRTDILGAHRAKMPYLLINNYRKWKYDSRIPYINHLKDLIPYLKEHYGNTI